MKADKSQSQPSNERPQPPPAAENSATAQIAFPENPPPGSLIVPPAGQPSGGTGLRLGGNTGLPILAGWKDGFFLASENRDFVLRVTGQIQADEHSYLNDKDQVDTDSFFLRRARFGIEADMAKYYEFRFLPDFALGKTVIQDCYMNVHYWNEFQFEIGKFKQPVSYEQLIQDRFVPTLERSMFDQLVPSRTKAP